MNKKIELPIFMYHRVIKTKDEEGIFGTYVYESELKKQFQYLKSSGIETITFQDVKDGILEKKGKYIILTFDDGYKDNYTILYPLLKEFSFKAVIYPVTNEDYNSWDSDNSINPEKKLELMSWKEMYELKESGLVEFGAHTKTHCNLLKTSKLQFLEEIRDSKLELEKRLSINVLSFAYPYGFFTKEHKDMLKEFGYVYGVATATGPTNFYEDLYHIRRIGIFNKDNIVRYKKKVKSNYSLKKVRAEKLKEFRRKIKALIGWKK
ncbi:MAG: polysaccharide deacetylase family protein [Fusobacteriaceae bacterium]